MSDRILVPYDGSPSAGEALEQACDLFPSATIVALVVIDPAEASYSGEEASLGDGWRDDAIDSAEETLDEARERAEPREIETRYEIGRPSTTIVEFVEEENIDHVVMGSSGRTGVARLLLGSVAETVVRRSPVPVTVVR